MVGCGGIRARWLMTDGKEGVVKCDGVKHNTSKRRDELGCCYAGLTISFLLCNYHDDDRKWVWSGLLWLLKNSGFTPISQRLWGIELSIHAPFVFMYGRFPAHLASLETVAAMGDGLLTIFWPKVAVWCQVVSSARSGQKFNKKVPIPFPGS
jgi:hypothetical protein